MWRWVVAGVLVLFACTEGTPPGEPPFPQSSPTGSGPSSPGVDPNLYVRTCESSVYGDLGRGWRRREISAGPVTFVGARGYADDPGDRFSAPGARATSHKVLIVVEGEHAVMLSLRHPDAALAYDPERWLLRNLVPFSSGYALTRFEPCIGDDQRGTQFNGAFLLRGPACVPLEVRPEGGAPIFITLSFGAGGCS